METLHMASRFGCLCVYPHNKAQHLVQNLSFRQTVTIIQKALIVGLFREEGAKSPSLDTS
jgi:hypothetical protein